MTTVSAHDARRNLSELLELAFYKNARVRIQRNNKPMAWLVGEPFMQSLEKFVDYIIDNEPALADTLAILLNDEVREAIEQSTEEVEQGKTLPIEKALED